MKMIYQGIQRIQGFKKGTTDPFDMAICYVGVPIDQGSFGKDPNRKTIITGYGLKPAEVEATIDCIPKFEKIPSGALVEFETDQRFFAGELKTVICGGKVVGLPQVQPVAKVA